MTERTPDVRHECPACGAIFDCAEMNRMTLTAFAMNQRIEIQPSTSVVVSFPFDTMARVYSINWQGDAAGIVVTELWVAGRSVLASPVELATLRYSPISGALLVGHSVAFWMHNKTDELRKLDLKLSCLRPLQ